MLDSTLQARFAQTKAIKLGLPKKTFNVPVNKAAANKQSRLGNELLNKQDDPPAALKAYQAAYDNDPSNSEIVGSYGYALFRNGQFPLARDKTIECLEISPGYGAAWFVLGQIYGYLQQEDYAYASFVNTCLFTKNIQTTLGFLERERDKYGEASVKNAAARALEACRMLEAGNVAAAEVPPSRPPVPATAANLGQGSPRIGMIDLVRMIYGNRLVESALAEVRRAPNVSEKERNALLAPKIQPVIRAIGDASRRYARANGYRIIILATEEKMFRQEGHLSKATLPLVEVDESLLAFLNSDAGRQFRRTAVINDLTQAIGDEAGVR